MNAILASILRDAILITPEGANSYLPILANVLNGKVNFNKEAATEFIAANSMYKMESFSGSSESTKPQYVGVVSIVGGITKYNQDCGPRGMVTKEREIKQLLQDPDVSGIILRLDTPGGQASYLDVISNTIRNAEKPIVAFVEGGAYSAGYWLASACKEVYLNSPLDGVGSIGVMTTLVDHRDFLKNQGIKLEIIYAPESTEKNKEYHDVFDAEKPDYSLIKSHLSELAQAFHAAININRNITDKSALAGATFSGQKAIDLGLADGFKSLDECAQRVVELANKNKSNSNTMTKTKNYTNIAKVAFANGENSEIVLTEGSASLTEAVLDNIEAKLGENETLASANAQLTLDHAAVKATADFAGPLVKSIAESMGLNEPTTADEATAFIADAKRIKEERDAFASDDATAETDTGADGDYNGNNKIPAYMKQANATLSKNKGVL